MRHTEGRGNVSTHIIYNVRTYVCINIYKLTCGDPDDDPPVTEVPPVAVGVPHRYGDHPLVLVTPVSTPVPDPPSCREPLHQGGLAVDRGCRPQSAVRVRRLGVCRTANMVLMKDYLILHQHVDDLIE